MNRKVLLPKGKYIKNIVVNDDGLDIEFAKRKKIGLLFVCINPRYWPYLKQVIEDCRKNFLPQHNVEYLVWSDIPLTDTPEFLKGVNTLLTEEQLQQAVIRGERPGDQWWGKETIRDTVDFFRNQNDIHVFETDKIDWPAPTLMRYHLFLQQEDKLKDYEYLFYLDADMRVVEKISDEVIGEGLTAAEHPMYSLAPRYIPPYEPNPESSAYIHRLGQVVDDGGKPRFKPYYVAGGFQGGKTKLFIEAMQVMKENIDTDFNKNYVAIWNDESHWNKYLWDYYKGPLLVLSPSYIHPDSLINEYYKPLWGQDYPPKIITITKPFSLSKQAGSELNKLLGGKTENSQSQNSQSQCPLCRDMFDTPGYVVKRVVKCPGSGKAHQLDLVKT